MKIQQGKAKKNIKKKQKKQLAVITLVILIASVIAILLMTPAFNVKKITVKGNHVIETSDIIAAANIEENVNIFDINLDSAEANIKNAIGQIKEVEIKRRLLSSTIEINVVEEVGVAYIKAEEGYVIITANGRCIDITDGIENKTEDNKNSVALPKLPLITGLDKVKYKVGETITSENKNQLEVLFDCLHEFSKQGHIFDMVEIDMSDMKKIEFYYLSRKLRVSVGDGSNVEFNMNCFGPILDEVEKAYGPSPEGFIDLPRQTYRQPEETTETEQKENS